MEFLITSGLPEQDAQMAMLTSSRFTVGSVPEEQADAVTGDPDVDFPFIDHESAFEAGMALIIDGVALRQKST